MEVKTEQLRLLYNRAIVGRLAEYIEKYPHIRFGQLLINLGIVPDDMKTFAEEPEITWKKLLNNGIN